ncbi:MAG: ATP-binding protein [Alteromonadaceae bacterium]|nr:ATP-binding protein [Alteromonadaceae bacterium]
MLASFKVTNFKNFKNEFVLDLTKTKNYEFSRDSIHTKVASNTMIYGVNGCGKSNLTLAVFDIKNHLTDQKTPDKYQENYLNAESESDLAVFEYTFKFQESIIIYTYKKRSFNEIVFENLVINDVEVLSIDRDKSSTANINLVGAETLNKNLLNSDVSLVKYVMNNSVLEVNEINTLFRTMCNFVQYMQNSFNVNSVLDSSRGGKTFDDWIIDEGIDTFETFLNEMGVKCSLAVRSINGSDVIVFDYGSKYIEFSKAASTGTNSLYNLYIDIYIMKTTCFICNSKKKIYQQAPNIQDLNNNVTQFGQKELEHNDLFNDHDFIPFLFIDEFDACFHHKAAKQIVTLLKEENIQFILTTHNTSIMTNDLLRPDCYFIMEEARAKPVYESTDRELRKAHNLEKMYRTGAFDE